MCYDVVPKGVSSCVLADRSFDNFFSSKCKEISSSICVISVLTVDPGATSILFEKQCAQICKIGYFEAQFKNFEEIEKRLRKYQK